MSLIRNAHNAGFVQAYGYAETRQALAGDGAASAAVAPREATANTVLYAFELKEGEQ